MKKKGQTWSMDIVIAVVLFIAAFIIFYGLLNKAPGEQKAATLSKEGTVIVEILESEQEESKISFIEGSELRDEAFTEFTTLPYNETKALLGIQSDYCIHFEDEEGNLIAVEGVKSIGSPDLKLLLNDSTGTYTLECGTNIIS